MAYLRRRSEIHGSNLSDALAAVIEEIALGNAACSPRIARKARAHVALSSEHLALIDRQAVRLGVVRSDVVRRLIDEAMTRVLPQ